MKKAPQKSRGAPSPRAPNEVVDRSSTPSPNRSHYVNYMDIKLHGVMGIPPEWWDSGAAENDNPKSAANATLSGPALHNLFRYVVSLELPALAPIKKDDSDAADDPGKEGTPIEDTIPTVEMLEMPNGRLLQLLPAYVEHIEAAKVQEPSAAATWDPLSCSEDPREGEGEPAGALSEVPQPASLLLNEAVVKTLRRDGSSFMKSTKSIPAEVVRRQNGNTGSRGTSPGGAAAATTTTTTTTTTAEGAPPPAILWVPLLDETAVSNSFDGTSDVRTAQNTIGGNSGSGLKRRKKNPTGAAAAAAAATTSPPASLVMTTMLTAGAGAMSAGGVFAAHGVLSPHSSATFGGGSGGAPAAAMLLHPTAAPLCVLRVPLDRPREAYLADLARSGTPLLLRFRRVLRADAPADWEDHNAGYFEAYFGVDLRPLREPGSCEISRAVVPLCPRAGGGAAATMPAARSGGGATPPSSPDPMARTTASSLLAPVDADRVGGGGSKKLKPTAARRAKAGGIPATLYEEPPTGPGAAHAYALAGTTAMLSVRLGRTLAPLVSDRVRPALTPRRLLRARRTRGQAPTPPAPSRETRTGPQATADGKGARPGDAAQGVARALDAVVRKVLRDYRAGAGPAGDPTPEAAEAWRGTFFDALQASGQLQAYKAQLMPLVVRLVRERLAGSNGGGRTLTLTPEQLSQLSNELYVYLLDCVHGSLNNLAEPDHRQAAPPAEGRGGLLARGGCLTTDAKPENEKETETETDLWITRAMEAELSGDCGPAETYHQARVTAAVQRSPGGALPQLCCVWADAADFYVRIGDIAKAEQAYREAITCDSLYLRALLAYGMLLMAYDRLSEAAVYVHSSVEVSDVETLPLVWGCVALLNNLYMLHVREESPDYEAELSKWERERRLAVQRALQAAQTPPASREEGDGSLPQPAGTGNAAELAAAFQAQTIEQEEVVFLYVARYAVQLQHAELANICLARCRLGSTCVELLYARLFAQTGQHRHVLETLDALAASQQTAEIEHVEDSVLEETSKNRATPVEGTAEAGLANGEETPGGGVSKPSIAPQTDPQVLRDEILLLRAQSEEALGNLDEAIRLYKTALCKKSYEDHERRGAETGVVEAPISRVPEYLLAAPQNAAKPKLLDEFAVGHSLHYRFCLGYLRLGNLLLSRGRYKDAAGVFTLGMQAWPLNSLMWLGAGIGYYRAGNLVATEACLDESNVCNPLNPRTWAFLTLLCMRTHPEQLETMLQQTLRHGLPDAALWAELGCELLITANQPLWSVRCLQRALGGVVIPTHRKAQAADEDEEVVEGPSAGGLANRNALGTADFKSGEAMAPIQNMQTYSTYTSGLMQGSPGLPPHLVSICLYHLSHALLRLNRIEEARQVLEMVARDTLDEVLREKAEADLKHCV